MLPQREEIASLVVCEDDDVTLDLLCEHLAADRFGVMPAPSASDALRLCRYNHPDLLLLDLTRCRTPPGSTSCARSARPTGSTPASTRACR